MTRRTLMAALTAAAASGVETPRIAHRQASMHTDGPAVFDLAKRIRGMEGVELQIHRGGESLWDKATLAAYRDGARRTGIEVPSVAGVWQKGESLIQPAAANSLHRAVDVAAEVGARVIL